MPAPIGACAYSWNVQDSALTPQLKGRIISCLRRLHLRVEDAKMPVFAIMYDRFGLHFARGWETSLHFLFLATQRLAATNSMGKQFTAIMPDGTKRFAADFSMGRAALFYDIALLLERYVHLPCGIAPDPGDDEHHIEPALFIAFFECVWRQGWMTDNLGGFLVGWAEHAAGIIANITLQERTWTDRNGVPLFVRRYLREEEIQNLKS